MKLKTCKAHFFSTKTFVAYFGGIWENKVDIWLLSSMKRLIPSCMFWENYIYILSVCTVEERAAGLPCMQCCKVVSS